MVHFPNALRKKRSKK